MLVGLLSVLLIALLGCSQGEETTSETTTTSDTPTANETADTPEADALRAVVDGDHRSESNTARDQYRNPYETLKFFGLEEDMTVVEISPGGGAYYLEILAPYLKEKGKYYAASWDPERNDYSKSQVEKLDAFLAAKPEAYSAVNIVAWEPRTGKMDVAPEGVADMVLTFRNVHNWMAFGYKDDAFAGFARALKPGGILGIVEHRANTDVEQDPKAASGYVREDYVIQMAEAAGFELVEKSEINANPKDTKDHPKGVWTLPPSMATQETDGEKYREIGESDRMTLKFRKK
jgi:predicted methyltransferase